MRAERGIQLVERDKNICSFLARYKVATDGQIEREFFRPGTTATRRLGKLKKIGLVRGECVFHGGPTLYWVTASGARYADEDLPAPKLDVTKLNHTLQLVDLSWALRNGVSADGGGVDLSLWPWLAYFSERELRRDRLRARREAGTGRMGPGKLGHFPDALLVLRDGRRVAIELELSPKRNNRYEASLRDYRSRVAAGEIDAVRWYFTNAQVLRRFEQTVGALKVRGLCELRTYRLPGVLERMRELEVPGKRHDG